VSGPAGGDRLVGAHDEVIATVDEKGASAICHRFGQLMERVPGDPWRLWYDVIKH
jgi:hypothetical protein